VKQGRLPMVLEGFFQLDSGFSMKGLGRQEGLAGNGCIGLGHGVALLGGQQNVMYWEMGGLYATEQTAPLSATTGMGAYSARSRTRFHADGGQHSAVMADSIPHDRGQRSALMADTIPR
jgi:hypothetical protein